MMFSIYFNGLNFILSVIFIPWFRGFQLNSSVWPTIISVLLPFEVIDFCYDLFFSCLGTSDCFFSNSMWFLIVSYWLSCLFLYWLDLVVNEWFLINSSVSSSPPVVRFSFYLKLFLWLSDNAGLLHDRWSLLTKYPAITT